MSVQHEVNQQLAALSQGGGEVLQLNERGLCAIEIADEYEGHISVPPTDNLVVFCLSVAPVTLDDWAALYGYLLAMNYLDEQTQGVALCLDPSHSDIILRYSLPAEHLKHDSVARLLGALYERATALAASLGEWQREQARDHGLLALAKELANAKDGKAAYFPVSRDPKEFLSFQEQFRLNMSELLMDDPGKLEDPMELKSGFDDSLTPFARAQETKRKLVKAAENDSFESEVSNIRKSYKLPEKTNVKNQPVTPGGTAEIGKTPGIKDGDTAKVPGNLASAIHPYNLSADHPYNPSGVQPTDPDYYDDLDGMDEDISYLQDAQDQIDKAHDDQQLGYIDSLDDDEYQFQNKIKRKNKKVDKQVLIDGGGGNGGTKIKWKIRPKDPNANKPKVEPQPSIDNSLPAPPSSNTGPITIAKGGSQGYTGPAETGNPRQPNRDEFATNISRAAAPEKDAPGRALLGAETNDRLVLQQLCINGFSKTRSA